jgi:hypothetical protein
MKMIKMLELGEHRRNYYLARSGHSLL